MANMQLRTFEGLRSQAPVQTAASSLQTGRSCPRVAARFQVLAAKKVKKTTQVILKQDVVNIGKKGELAKVVNGYWRNYLKPLGYAVPATEGILASIQRGIEAEERTKKESKAKAQAMANALATIGKFSIRKKVGAENAIYGSVTAENVVATIEQQTGRALDKRAVDIPDIKTLGTYDVSIKLHPEVTGSFKVVVVKDTSAS